jgi:hypothetical protein
MGSGGAVDASVVVAFGSGEEDGARVDEVNTTSVDFAISRGAQARVNKMTTKIMAKRFIFIPFTPIILVIWGDQLI